MERAPSTTSRKRVARGPGVTAVGGRGGGLGERAGSDDGFGIGVGAGSAIVAEGIVL